MPEVVSPKSGISQLDELLVSEFQQPHYPNDMAAANAVLQKAATLINEDRRSEYGPPLQSFHKIAAMWGTYLGMPITAKDVAAMMVLLKVSRFRSSDYKSADSLVDIAGYAALANII